MSESELAYCLSDYLSENRDDLEIFLLGLKAGVFFEGDESSPFNDSNSKAKIWYKGFYAGQARLEQAQTQIILDYEKVIRVIREMG